MSGDMTIDDRIVAAVRRLVRAVDMHSRWLVEEYGLTGPQLATLKEAARLGPVSVTVLAKAAHISKPTMTGILDRLEQGGLIERQRASEDRRSITICLTEAGTALVGRIPSLLHERFRQRLNRLEEWEQTSLLAALQRLAGMMEAEGLDASPLLVSGPVEATGEEVRRASAAADTAYHNEQGE